MYDKIPPMKNNVGKILRLDKNENFFPHHVSINKVIKQGVDRLVNFYPPQNSLNLYHKLAGFHELDKDNLFIGPGLESVIVRVFMAARSSLNIKKIILPDFSWQHYEVMAKSSFIDKTVYFPVKDDISYFSIDIDLLIECVKDNPESLVVLPNPNNPTGKGLDTEEIFGLISTFPTNIFFIDEAYAGFGKQAYNSNEQLKEFVKRDNVIIGRSFSKFFAVPGARLGYAIMSKDLRSRLRLIPLYLGLSNFTEKLSMLLMDHYDFYEKRAQKVKEVRDLFTKRSASLPVKMYSSEASFVFGKFLTPVNTKKLVEYLRKGGFYIKLFDYGKPLVFFRITVGSKASMLEILRVLEGFFISRRRSPN